MKDENGDRESDFILHPSFVVYQLPWIDTMIVSPPRLISQPRTAPPRRHLLALGVCVVLGFVFSLALPARASAADPCSAGNPIAGRSCRDSSFLPQPSSYASEAFSSAVLFAEEENNWSIGRLLGSLNHRSRIIPFCVGVMALALFILMKKFCEFDEVMGLRAGKINQVGDEGSGSRANDGGRR